MEIEKKISHSVFLKSKMACFVSDLQFSRLWRKTLKIGFRTKF